MADIRANDERFIEEDVFGFFLANPMSLPVLGTVGLIPIETRTRVKRVLRLRHDFQYTTHIYIRMRRSSRRGRVVSRLKAWPGTARLIAAMKKTIAVLFVLAVSAAAQKPFDTPIPKDHPVPAAMLANRQSYSAIDEVLKRDRVAVTDAQIEELKKHQLEGLWGAMGEYRETNYIRGFKTTRPGERLVGRALTMRFLPSRPDLARAARTLAKEADWDRRFYIRAGEEAQPNDVIVVDLGGAQGGNLFGDVTALGIKMRDAAGVIIDGGTRDLAELSADKFAGFPVFARFFDIHGNTWVGAEWNVPIRVGEVAVIPGDIVVADEGGILFIPPQMVAQVLKTANGRLAREDYERNLIEQKKYRIREVYPLHPTYDGAL